MPVTFIQTVLRFAVHLTTDFGRDTSSNAQIESRRSNSRSFFLTTASVPILNAIIIFSLLYLQSYHRALYPRLSLPPQHQKGLLHRSYF